MKPRPLRHNDTDMVEISRKKRAARAFFFLQGRELSFRRKGPGIRVGTTLSFPVLDCRVNFMRAAKRAECFFLCFFLVPRHAALVRFM